MSRTRLDALDLRIVGELTQDGRVSNREIARRLDVSEGAIRGRIKKLESDDVLRITAVVDPSVLRGASLAYAGVDTEGGMVRSVAAALAEMREFVFVALSMGRYDILTLAVTEGRAEASKLLLDRVARIPGVRRTETAEVIEVVKHAFRWVRLT